MIPLVAVTEKGRILIRINTHISASQARELASGLLLAAGCVEPALGLDVFPKKEVNGALMRWAIKVAENEL